MNSIKTNPILKEANNADKNYQLNMEILSSLKSLPNKVVNLQSEKIIFNDENLNKKVIFPEEKFTTSSSISKDLYCDPFSNDVDKIPKKSYTTTNSVFKPIIYNNPIKKTTMNFYNFDSMMSFSEFIIPNPTQVNPLKITNSSFSKNSCYPLINPEMPLVNPTNLINPNYSINPINVLNPINNNINPVNPFLQNFTQISLINDQIIKKNNLNQNKNNIFLNKKRNADDNENINLNIKEKKNKEKEEENKENECKIFNEIKKNNNIPKPKSTFFCVKQIHQENKENPSKKNLFTVIQKSNYIYKKRKPRKKKLFNGIKKQIKCGHEGCEGIFKTKKQLVFHHYKMNSECHNDTINLIKMINLTKKILLKKVEQKEKFLEKYSELYKETMKKISLDEHIETLVGLNFEDDLNEKI